MTGQEKKPDRSRTMNEPFDVLSGGDFEIGPWHVHVLQGPRELLADVHYLSFTGDFGFRYDFGIPSEAVIAEHVQQERELLSHFHTNIINFEFILPGIGGPDVLWESDFAAYIKERGGAGSGKSDGRGLPMKWYFYLESLMLETLKGSGFNAVSLANNHALDYGPDGVRYNKTRLSEEGMSVFGTKDHPHIEVSIHGKKGAVFAMTDYLDKGEGDGVIYMLEDANLAFLKGELEKFDFAVAFVQLISRSRSPNSYEVSQIDRLVEAGFDLIVCTGSHWIKGFAYRKGVPVAFGIGNQLFSYDGDFTEPFGMHFVSGVRDGKIVQLFLIPFHNNLRKGIVGPFGRDDFLRFAGIIAERSVMDEKRFFGDEITLYEFKRCLSATGFLPTELTAADLLKMDRKAGLFAYYGFRTLLCHYPRLLNNFLKRSSLALKWLLSLPIFVVGLLVFLPVRVIPFLRRRFL